MSRPAVFEKKKQGPLFWVVTAVGLILIIAAFSLIDLESFHRKAGELNGWLVFLIMVLAPMACFPVSIVYVLGGAKFGSSWGMVLVVAAVVFHLIAAWWIARSWLRRPLSGVLERFNVRIPQIPEGEDVPICLLVALIPGVSYAVKNYMLVLAGARFHPFFWTCLAANTFHASLAVFIGDFTSNLNRPKIIFLASYGVLLIGLSHYVVYRLRRRTRVRAVRQAEFDQNRFQK